MNKTDEILETTKKVQKMLNKLYESELKVPLCQVAGIFEGLIRQMMTDERSVINHIAKETGPELVLNLINSLTGSFAISLLASTTCGTQEEVKEIMEEFELPKNTKVNYESPLPKKREEKVGKA